MRRHFFFFQRRVAGNIAKDNAKNLRIEEYNALFGVTEATETASQIAAKIASSFQERLIQEMKKKKKKKAKAKKSGSTASWSGGFPLFDPYGDEYDSADY